ncbi:Proline iminopeptidase [Brachybacterium faecium]|nr:Proline iminopeptidase [Brachybacterium faecium]
MQYHLPGLLVRERTLAVPLDWSSPDGEQIAVFVRELVDPERRDEELPLLTYLQGGPGGENPRPLRVDGWIAEALPHYRIVLVDQRGTGRSTPLDAVEVAARGDGTAGADFLSCFRADSIVQDLEHVRHTVYDGRRWATLAQSYGGWLTLTYLSRAPEALSACYVCGGIPGTPPDPAEVYRRTFPRVQEKTHELYRRFPQDLETVAEIADHLEQADVRLPDGDRLTVRRFQTLGQDLGFGPGHERLHWLLEGAFIRPGRMSDGFLMQVLQRTSSASGPLFWTLQESIYGDGPNGPLAWAAQRERDRRPEFGEDRRPLLFTGEMAFPWMFEEVRLLRGLRPAVEELAWRTDWSPLYDLTRLAENEVPLAAAVYFDDMFVDAELQLSTLRRIGNSCRWVTNEFEHDGIGSGRTFTTLREMVRDRGGERS